MIAIPSTTNPRKMIAQLLLDPDEVTCFVKCAMWPMAYSTCEILLQSVCVFKSSQSTRR